MYVPLGRTQRMASMVVASKYLANGTNVQLTSISGVAAGVGAARVGVMAVVAAGAASRFSTFWLRASIISPCWVTRPWAPPRALTASASSALGVGAAAGASAVDPVLMPSAEHALKTKAPTMKREKRVEIFFMANLLVGFRVSRRVPDHANNGENGTHNEDDARDPVHHENPNPGDDHARQAVNNKPDREITPSRVASDYLITY